MFSVAIMYKKIILLISFPLSCFASIHNKNAEHLKIYNNLASFHMEMEMSSPPARCNQ